MLSQRIRKRKRPSEADSIRQITKRASISMPYSHAGRPELSREVPVRDERRPSSAILVPSHSISPKEALRCQITNAPDHILINPPSLTKIRARVDVRRSAGQQARKKLFQPASFQEIGEEKRNRTVDERNALHRQLEIQRCRSDQQFEDSEGCLGPRKRIESRHQIMLCGSIVVIGLAYLVVKPRGPISMSDTFNSSLISSPRDGAGASPVTPNAGDLPVSAAMELVWSSAKESHLSSQEPAATSSHGQSSSPTSTRALMSTARPGSSTDGLFLSPQSTSEGGDDNLQGIMAQAGEVSLERVLPYR